MVVKMFSHFQMWNQWWWYCLGYLKLDIKFDSFIFITSDIENNPGQINILAATIFYILQGQVLYYDDAKGWYVVRR